VTTLTDIQVYLLDLTLVQIVKTYFGLNLWSIKSKQDRNGASKKNCRVASRHLSKASFLKQIMLAKIKSSKFFLLNIKSCMHANMLSNNIYFIFLYK
jgi:hypothetical protein